MNNEESMSTLFFNLQHAIFNLELLTKENK